MTKNQYQKLVQFPHRILSGTVQVWFDYTPTAVDSALQWTLDSEPSWAPPYFADVVVQFTKQACYVHMATASKSNHNSDQPAESQPTPTGPCQQKF